MKLTHLLVGLGLSVSLAACGSGDGDPMAPPGSGLTPPDGELPPDGEELPPGADECNEEPGAVYEVAAGTVWNVEFYSLASGNNVLTLIAPLDGSFDEVEMTMDFYEGFPGGSLEAGIVAGTYPLEGVELDQDKCSICVYGFGNASGWNATGGTVTIEEIDLVPGGAFRMSLTGLTLGGIDLEQEFLPDCTVSLADTTIEDVLAESGPA